MTPLGSGRSGLPVIGKVNPRTVAGYDLRALSGVRGRKLDRGAERFVPQTFTHRGQSPGEILETEFFLGIKRAPAEAWLSAEEKNFHWEGLYIGDPSERIKVAPFPGADPGSFEPTFEELLRRGRLRIAQQWGFVQTAAGGGLGSSTYGPFFQFPFTPSVWDIKATKFPNEVPGAFPDGWFNDGWIGWMPTSDRTFPSALSDLAFSGVCVIPRNDPSRNVHVLKELIDKTGTFFNYWRGGEPGPKEIETLAAENAVGDRHEIIDEFLKEVVFGEEQADCVWQEVFSKWKAVPRDPWTARWGFPEISSISGLDFIQPWASAHGQGVCVDIPISLEGLQQKTLMAPEVPGFAMPLIEPGMKGWLIWGVGSCPGFAITEQYPLGGWGVTEEEGNQEGRICSEIVLGSSVRRGTARPAGDLVHGMVRMG